MGAVVYGDRQWKIDDDVPFGSERSTIFNLTHSLHLTTLTIVHTPLVRRRSAAEQHAQIIHHDPRAPAEQSIEDQPPIGALADPTPDGETTTSAREMDPAARGRRARRRRGVCI